MKEQIEQFLEYIAVRKSNNTYFAYLRDLTQFRAYLWGINVESWEQVSVSTIEDFLTRLAYKPRTLNRKRSAISSFLKFLSKRDAKVKNVARDVEPFRYAKRHPDHLGMDDIRLLRQACKQEWLSAMVEFMLNTGVRRAEVCSVNTRQIDLGDRKATVIGKGDKERTVLFSSACANTLELYLSTRENESEAMFIDEEGNRINPYKLNYELSKAGRTIGRRIYPHLLRHTAATMMLEGGMSIAEVQQLMGHEDVRTTSEYTHVTLRLGEVYDKAMKELGYGGISDSARTSADAPR